MEIDAKIRKAVVAYRDEVVADVLRFRDKVQPLLREMIAVAVGAAQDALGPDAEYDEVSSTANHVLGDELSLYVALCDGDEEWPVEAFLQGLPPHDAPLHPEPVALPGRVEE